MKVRLVLAAFIGIAALAGLLGTLTQAAPTPTHPIVRLTYAVPVQEWPGHYAAVWTIDFAKGIAPAPAVSHAEDREVWVTKGTMLVASDDLPGGTRRMTLGEKVTIHAGHMHQWINVGDESGAIVATGVVEKVKLHDACGGAG
jgi:quercetin dioxygenase-like cupin family protein